MESISSRPIGIFDSGIGGLTVAHAITKILPEESIIYFGDTAHLPYGDKSTAAIQAYSVKICNLLLQKQCKLILIACNSASAAAYELVKEYTGSKASVMNVIDPVVNHIRENYQQKRLGLIGTRQTVNSNVFKRKLDAINNNIQLHSLATPLLVPIIEEGFHQHRIAQDVIHEYLTHPNLSKIDALILACTHYPLIKKQINHFYQDKVTIIDSSLIVAEALKGWLEFHNLLNKSGKNTRKFLVSDYTDSFSQSAKSFFQENVHLEHYPLWD